MYVRVRDPQTGHHFDVTERSRLLRLGLVVPVIRYGPSPVPRPPKHRLARRRTEPTTEES